MRLLIKWILLCLLFSAFLPPMLLAQGPPAASTVSVARQNGDIQANVTISNAAGAQYHPSRLLVKFRAGVRQFLPGSTSTANFPLDRDLFLVNTPPGLDVPAAVAQYKRNPNVVYAEPDYTVSVVTDPVQTIPNDTRWAEQWDMSKIAAPAAWTLQNGAPSVVVAVVDTGINETHPDLAGNVLPGYTCINVPAPPNDHCTAGQIDDFGHGTHVAGTIGAMGNNSLGIAGINWNVKMIAFKFLNSSGSGSTSDAVYAYNQIADLISKGMNIRVTNNSWGGGGPSQALKDAMAAVEALGVVNVCAAGNSNLNADFSPMYPGAFDNHGIISVLASDSGDLGASFTNYGLASVDIAAPGVNTLSTVPTGTCQLCDPLGYKLLSGTSMATPHVAGAIAAMLQKNGSLGAFMARDIILDPASYDTVSDPKARSTSTGGRLNLYKLLTNPKLATPPAQLNAFPTITVGPNVFASAGQLVTLSATANDTDDAAQNLRMTWGKSSSSTWLFGSMADQLFLPPSGNPSSFSAPAVGRTASTPYLAAVADNRGGGASAAQVVTVNPVSPTNGGPDGTFSATPLSQPLVNGAALVTLNYAPVDPDNKGTPLWDLWAAGQGGASGSCCYSGSSVTLKFTSAGVWRVSVSSIDRYLEGSSLATADRKTAVVSIGGVTGTPPLATASLSALSGPAPFTVTVDMKGSLAFDGKSISNYFISCGEGFVAGGSGTARSCTFDTPGTYWLLEQIQDSAGLMDLVSLYVVVTPPNVGGGGGGDTTPPTVSITSPSANSKLNGTAVPVAANATDNPGGLGMKNVVFRLDDPINGSIIATVLGAGPTFTTNWNTAGVADGAHMLYAIATDNANLSTTSSGIAVVVDNTAPTVSITSPSPNAILKGTQQISANPTDNAGGSGIKNVVFRLDNPTSGVIINTVSGPFTTNWDTTGVADGSHMLFAIASDNANNSTTSSGISVMVDNNGPTVSITQPTGTSPVFGTISIVASASDSPGTGVKNVVFWVDNATLGNPVTSPPYSVSWNTKLYSDAPHTLKAIATDNNGNSTTSAPVTVTVDNTIQPPTITLGFSPAPAKKATVTITATATPSTGAKITKVDFYINGVLVGTDTTSAYTYTWKVPASAGKTYNISAIVTDSAGQTATATTSVNP